MQPETKAVFGQNYVFIGKFANTARVNGNAGLFAGRAGKILVGQDDLGDFSLETFCAFVDGGHGR